MSWSLAYGSCHHQSKPAPALLTIASTKPDVFAWLGDNLYNDYSVSSDFCEPISCGTWPEALHSRGQAWILEQLARRAPRLAARVARRRVRQHNKRAGSRDIEALQRNYATLGGKYEFQALRSAVPRQIATWDDHDFCRNGAGSTCPHASTSRALFLSFWRGANATAARGQRGGVYEGYMYSVPGGTVQVLLLDLRTWRSDHLYPSPHDAGGCVSSASEGLDCGYCAQPAGAMLLGEEQWNWLAEEMRRPATVRVIGSSLQFGSWPHNRNGDETWAAFPHEHARMLHLLRETRAEGVVFISGDLHYGEISRVSPSEPDMYPLYDVTSSGLTQSWPSFATNDNRVSTVVRDNNWGRLQVWLEVEEPRVDIAIMGVDGTPLANVSIPLRELRFAGRL